MSKNVLNFDDVLAIASLAELRAEAFRWRPPLTLPQVRQLTSRAEDLAPKARELRLGIVHTYTSDLLDPWLKMAAALEGFELGIHHAPYGLAIDEARADSMLVTYRPDLTLLLLRREDLHPEIAKPIVSFDAKDQSRLRTEVVQRLHSVLDLFRAQRVGTLVLTVLPATSGPALGNYDAHSDRSELAWWAALKSDIGQSIRASVADSLLLDLEDVLQQIGRDRFFDLRFWYTARFPFTSEAAREIARRVINIGVLLKRPRAKVLALDADNTLWHGILGEDGPDGIGLGPEYPGAAYVDFQHRLLGFQQRGLILALCSKNNPGDVDQVLRDHPHQVLRHEHFAALRVNWEPKADNLAAVARELNVGLESVVFVDDSDHECAAIRHVLPQVEVIQVPARTVDVPRCLDHVARLEILSLTSEDLGKTELYAQERQRQALSANVVGRGGAVRDYLVMLGMRMEVHIDAMNHVARLSQLTQKTNQFNLTTHRYDEQQIKSFIADDRWLVADFSLTDSFGHSGIVGLALFRIRTPGQAELDTFLMSCRVIGREAESAFLHALLRETVERGVTLIVADFQETSKNELAKSFLPAQGFERCADGRYRRDLVARPPEPEGRFPIAVHFAQVPDGAAAAVEARGDALSIPGSP
jgi:FkbH-like protein